MPDGEVRTVMYPHREHYQTILFKKTIIGYLSAKFNNLGEVRNALTFAAYDAHVVPYARIYTFAYP